MFNKITDEMRLGKGNVGLPDTPGLTTPEMQAKMDELGNLAIDGHNAHIDELGANTAAANLGATVPTGITANENIQSVLTALAILALNVAEKKHGHDNKSTLDSITTAVKSGYDDLVQVFSGINAVQQSMTATETSVPSSKAVISYVDGVDVSEKAFNASYPIGTVFMTTSTVDPFTLFGYGQWQELGQRDQYGISRYERIG